MTLPQEASHSTLWSLVSRIDSAKTDIVPRTLLPGGGFVDWKKHYTELPAKYDETDFLRQVGKTINGQPIDHAQLFAQLADIQKALDLGHLDRLLDMCCGNGVLTAKLSERCQSVVGIDFSEPLIEIANRHNRPENVRYFCLSALDPKIANTTAHPFTKVYMYEALQHFEEDQLHDLLFLIRGIATADATIFIGGIPDNEKVWNFYDTDDRRRDYWQRKRENREAIGTWWKRDYISDACRSCRFDVEFLNQDPVLSSARYRFDVRLQPLK